MTLTTTPPPDLLAHQPIPTPSRAEYSPRRRFYYQRSVSPLFRGGRTEVNGGKRALPGPFVHRAPVRAGRIKPLLDRALPLSQAAEANRLVATNKVKGNLVLLPWAE